MSGEKPLFKSDIVSSIFSRQAKGKRRLSSLFGQREVEPTGTRPSLKKIFPFGLDIGTNSIKIVQLGLTKEGVMKITNLFIEELPKEAQGYNLKERGRILEPILKKTLERKGLKGDCFVTAPHIWTKINFIKLPQMPLNEIDKAVHWEIRQTSQGDPKEISLDYIILERQKVKFLGNQIGILAVTAIKKDMFECLAFLESVGLSPLAIDIESLADLAALDYTKKTLTDGESVLWLDFGAGKTSLNIICNGELISLRYLNVTGNSLTKAVSEYCRIPWEEAELMKKSFGLSISGIEQTSENLSDKAIQTRNAILPLLENMVQDIEYTFKYFSYQVTQSQITHFDRVILSGGSAHLKGLVPFLHNRLNVEVRLIDSLVNFEPLELTNLSLEELSPRMNVALGLALRRLE